MMQASTVVWKFPDLIGLNSPNPSVMHLGLLFALAIAQPGAAASNDMVTAMRRDTVHLPCHCPKSITVLVVYWQKVPYDTSRNFEEVKLKTLAGQEVTAHLDPRFASRAELDPQNVDLILRTVGVEDAGKYECIVSQRGPDTYLMKLHDFSVQLAVTGLEKEVDEPRNRFLLKAFAAICVPIVIFATAILVKCLKKRTADCPDGGIGQEVGGNEPAASREDGIELMARCEHGGHADVHQEDLVDETSTHSDAE